MNQSKVLSSMKRITRVFHDADHDNKGYLSREDLKFSFIVLLGYKPSKYQIDRLMEDCPDGMKLQTFTKIMSLKMKALDEDDVIKQMFTCLDSQCRGYLTVSDLRKAASTVAPHLHDFVLEKAFQEADRDGDQRVSYKDFEYMMKFDS